MYYAGLLFGHTLVSQNFFKMVFGDKQYLKDYLTHAECHCPGLD